MPLIGIIAALPIEAKALTQQKLQLGTTVALENKMLLHIGGVGAQAAGTAAQKLIQCGANMLISWGTAGGLSPHVAAGTLILAERVLGQGQVFETNPIVRERLRANLAGLPIDCGTLMETVQIISSVSTKKQLFVFQRAVAVDMESAAIALAAKQAGLPFAVIRAIVDTADFALPPWLSTCLDSNGRIKIGQLVKYVCWNPKKRISALIHLARAFSACNTNLKKAAKALSALAVTAEEKVKMEVV